MDIIKYTAMCDDLPSNYNCRHTKDSCHHSIRCLVKGLLLVGGDGAVGGWVGNAGEHKSIGHLVVIQERLVGLVNSSSLDLSGARRAGSGTARVWEVNSCEQKANTCRYTQDEDGIPWDDGLARRRSGTKTTT